MDLSKGLVLDTSVWINLLATEQPWEILDAIGARLIAPKAVVAELIRNPVTQQVYSAEKHPIRSRKSVSVVELEREELEVFLSLVAGNPADSLGDGEAAAISVAWARRCTIGLDDRKARRILQERYPQIQVLSSVDLLRSAAVVKKLGVDGSISAFERARQFGRMHVPKQPSQQKPQGNR